MLIQKIRHKIRHGLVVPYVLANLSRLGLKIAPYYLFEQGPLNGSEQISASYPEPDPYEVELLGASEMADVASFGGFHVDEQDLRNRLQSGARCVGVRYEGEIVAFLWCNFEECVHPPLRSRLAADEAYWYDGYVTDAHRGGRPSGCGERLQPCHRR